MAPRVESMVSATYVRDIDTSRGFYQLLGFRERAAGKADNAAWSALHHNEHSVLLVTTRPPLSIPPLPLLFYFYVRELDAVIPVVEAAGVEVVRVGHPPHALGGEVKVLDPDGNTVLLGQRDRATSQPPAADDRESPRFSLLKEAAALVAARGGTTAGCQVRSLHGTSCSQRAEVKLADAAGNAMWACLAHADEILLAVPGAFIASQTGPGLAGFTSGR